MQTLAGVTTPGRALHPRGRRRATARPPPLRRRQALPPPPALPAALAATTTTPQHRVRRLVVAPALPAAAAAAPLRVLLPHQPRRQPRRLGDALVKHHHLVARRRKLFQLHPDVRLNLLEELEVVLRDDRDAAPAAARARGAPHAVHVVFRVGGHVVVDDEVDVGHIEAARRDICGHQHRALACRGSGTVIVWRRSACVDGLARGAQRAPLSVRRRQPTWSHRTGTLGKR